MSDEDPWGDLNDMPADETSSDGAEVDTSEPEPEPEPEPESDPRLEPSFPFDDALQRPLYARSESWDDFEDVCDFEVKRLLRDDGVKNVEGRELHDAALRIAADNPELLADEIRRARGLDGSEEES